MNTNKLTCMLYDLIKSEVFENHKDTIEKMIKKQYIKNKDFDLHELNNDYYVFIKRNERHVNIRGFLLSQAVVTKQKQHTADIWNIYIVKRDALFNNVDCMGDTSVLIWYTYSEKEFVYLNTYDTLDVLYGELINNANIHSYDSNDIEVNDVNEDFKIMINKLISNDIDMLNGAV